MKCAICKIDTFKNLFKFSDYLSGDIFYLEKCSNCGVVRTKDIESVDQLAHYYPEDYFGARKSYVDAFINNIRVKKITTLSNFSNIHSKKILDIGCGTGDFLLSMKRKGWEIYGTEISQSRIEELQKKDIPVCDESKNECNYEENFFNIITAWHVLEHVIDPKNLLVKMHSFLKDDGKIIIEVPNFGSWQARSTRSFWFHIDAPRHIYHFTREGLRQLFNETGFEIEKISFYEPFYDIFGFVQSLLNTVSNEQNLLFSIINKKKHIKQFFSIALLRDTFLIIILTVPLIIIGIIQFSINILLKKGAIITVYGKKR